MDTETDKMINADFLSKFKKSIWFINTARGNSVVTEDLVEALNAGKVVGAGLDVLEYENYRLKRCLKEKRQNHLPIYYKLKTYF